MIRLENDLQMTVFGYTWDEIKRAQQGGTLARRLPSDVCKPLATEDDWELLERYGEAELRNRGYFGVLDRLENARQAIFDDTCATLRRQRRRKGNETLNFV